MTREQIIEQIKKLEKYILDDECYLLKDIYKDHIEYLRGKLKEIESKC